MKMKISALCAVMFLLLVCAQAVPVTIQITGNVTYANGSGLPNTIYKGVTFTGTYTYDSLTPDSDADSHRGEYQHNSPYCISIVLGGYEFKTAPNNVGQLEIRIVNDDPMANLWDSYMVLSYKNVSIPSIGPTIDYIRWDLGDITHNALSSDALPLTAPVLTDWSYNVLEIHGSGFTIRGPVTQAVPEPGTMVLMLVGVFLFKQRR